MIRLPDGREVDPINGCKRCGRADCHVDGMIAAVRDKGSRGGTPEEYTAIGEAKSDCYNFAEVDWRSVAAMLSARPEPEKVIMATLRSAFKEVRSERLESPSGSEGDAGYQQAIRDAENAVYSIGCSPASIAAIIGEAKP